MPAIRRQGRRLFLRRCWSVAWEWVFLCRFGVCAGFVFRPLGRVTFSNARK
jgi:hypothetical protein